MSRPAPHREHTAERGAVTDAILVLANGADNTHIRADKPSSRLFTAYFDGHQPAVAVADGTISVRYGAGLSPTEGRITLNTGVTWSVRIRNGAREIHADLTAVRLASIDVEGESSRLTLHLPRPYGRVPIRFRDQARQVRIVRPPRTCVRLTVSDGQATGITLDGQRLDDADHRAPLRSSAERADSGCYDIHTEAAVAHFSVEASHEEHR